MKSKRQRRDEAVARMESAEYKNSKACKKGTRTKEQWTAWNTAEIERISKITTGSY